jgi:hypothetical protein
MRRVVGALAFGSLFAVVSGCGSNAVTVDWTINGASSKSACALVKDAKIVVQTQSRQTNDSRSTVAPKIEDTTTDCVQDAPGVTVATGDFADVIVKLMSGADVLGTSTPITTSPSTNNGSQEIVANVVTSRSTLKGELTVVGKTCGDASVSSFSVDVYEESEPQNRVRVTSESLTVPCTGGRATFEVPNLRNDAIHVVVATAEGYVTQGDGEGFVTSGLVSVVTADLVPTN